MSDEVVNVVETPATEAPAEAAVEATKASKSAEIEAAKAAYESAKAAYESAQAESDKELRAFTLTVVAKYNLSALNSARNAAQKALHDLMVEESGEFAATLFSAKDAAKNARAQLADLTKDNAAAKAKLKQLRDSVAKARSAYKADKKNSDLKKALEEARAKLAVEEVARKMVRSQLKSAKAAAAYASTALVALKNRAPL